MTIFFFPPLHTHPLLNNAKLGFFVRVFFVYGCLPFLSLPSGLSGNLLPAHSSSCTDPNPLDYPHPPSLCLPPSPFPFDSKSPPPTFPKPRLTSPSFKSAFSPQPKWYHGPSEKGRSIPPPLGFPSFNSLAFYRFPIGVCQCSFLPFRQYAPSFCGHCLLQTRGFL